MLKLVANAQRTFHEVPRACVLSRSAALGISDPRRYGTEAPANCAMKCQQKIPGTASWLSTDIVEECIKHERGHNGVLFGAGPVRNSAEAGQHEHPEGLETEADHQGPSAPKEESSVSVRTCFRMVKHTQSCQQDTCPR